MRRGLLGTLAGVALNSAVRGSRRSVGMSPYARSRYRRRGGGSLLGILMLIFAGYLGTSHLQKTETPVQLLPQIVGRVQHVIDGDTFNLQGYAIRLWGIDAPERDTAYGSGATQTLQQLVRGRTLTCQPVDRSYERLVASCSMDGRDLSQVMVRLGWARDLPNKSGRRYQADEADARKAQRGLWKT